MQAELSPSYTHEKLAHPQFADMVDVFEDLWRKCVFDQAGRLLEGPNGDIAALTVLCPYFEAIGGYISGEPTDRRARAFFVKGFCEVFRSDSPELPKAAEAVYKFVRCGLAHEGMLGHRVNYSRAGSKAFFLTYRKAPDGSLDFSAGVVSIVVNPVRMYEGTLHHFDGYIRRLREGKDPQLATSFERLVRLQWALGGGENIVAITEEEFLGRA